MSARTAPTTDELMTLEPPDPRFTPTAPTRRHPDPALTPAVIRQVRPVQAPHSVSLSGSILVVCTANIVRSPVAALLLGEDLSGTGVTIESAGVAARAGAPMAPEMRSLLPASLADRVSAVGARHVTRDGVRSADLVLTATREQRAAVVTGEPSSLKRTFTLGEFAAWAQVLSERPSEEAVTTLQEVVALVPGIRATRRLADSEYDIDDPVGGSKLAYRRAYSLIEKRTTQIAQALLALAGGAVTAPR